jgi:tRNA uridine 5-carboxymethylaminomethyl modification enzyme
MKKNEFRKIPRSINYDYVEGLAKEAKEKLKKIKPENFGQATRIAGINPTDIQMLNYHLKKLKI